MSWQAIRTARLENEYVVLRPIAPEDRDQLREVAFDPDIWRYFVVRVGSEAELDRFIEDGLADTTAGRRVVYCVIDKASGRLAGCMCYGNMAEADLRLEIGWSWLGKDFRGAGLNRWAKYLLLEQAFETLGCERVEFKTDVLNIQARKGLSNIGATEEGVLRSYNFMPDGRRRDAVYYSILKSEWPRVRTALLQTGKVAALNPVA